MVSPVTVTKLRNPETSTSGGYNSFSPENLKRKQACQKAAYDVFGSNTSWVKGLLKRGTGTSRLPP